MKNSDRPKIRSQRHEGPTQSLLRHKPSKLLTNTALKSGETTFIFTTQNTTKYKKLKQISHIK